MPKIVDHEKRKEDIVKVAMEMLSENESLANINVVRIAKKCNLSRPTLYQYFHDKEEIYKFVIKNITNTMFARYSKMAEDHKPIESLENIVDAVINDASSYKVEILALLSLVIQSKNEGREFSKNLALRTRKFIILMKRLVNHAKQEGSFGPDCSSDKIANDVLYLLESACFNIAFFNPEDNEQAKKMVKDYIDSYKTSR